jgi:two-component system, sensor histidine kinase RpfC
MTMPFPQFVIAKIDALRLRLKARADSEHEQALLRLVIVGLFLAHMSIFHGSPAASRGPSDWTVITMLSGIFLAAVAIFAAICVWPSKNIARRLIGMLADNGAAAWYICLAGEYGFSMIGVFLFVAFGNGFRYGRRYLFASQALSLIGYGAILAFVPYWQGHRAAGIGLLIALIVLPLYVSTLIKRIQEARAKAEEANLAKTSFLANMSHEIRTPLNGIAGIVDLLRTTTLSKQQVELVGLLLHSTSVLRSLVDDVLDITKIESGRVTIEVAPFDLHACINGLMQLLRPHAQAKGLTLNAFVDPALEYRLKGDSHHLRQVLLNLLSNAVKFTERGEVNLAVALKQETERAITARFEVRDTGIGMAPAALTNIFERFVQADQSTTRKYGGTGLGTTIAKQLVELMGGSIGVESAVGKGSTFWLELPLLRDLAADETAPSGADPHELDQRGICLVIATPGDGTIPAILRSIGERYETIAAGVPLGAKVDQLKQSGIAIRAVLARCPVDQACAAFNAIVQRLPNVPVALIYVANGELSVVDRARVSSISGAYALHHATPRLISNAIHAVATSADGAATDRADLSTVLRRERASLRILVAEDNATNQKIIEQLLQGAGHEVMLASDGEVALDLYESHAPDLAILDFNMPQRTGVEVIQAIRMLEAPGVRMPAIILSASVTAEARERAAAAGADEFIGKPFDAASLISRIDRLAERAVDANGNTVARRKRSTPRFGIAAHGGLKGVERPGHEGMNGSASHADPTLVDQSRLAQLEDIARDVSFLSELIHGFMSDVDAILAKTRDVVATGNGEQIPDLMHSLKGAAVGVGATRLALLATDFDQSANRLSVLEMKGKLRDVESCSKATSAHLKQYLLAHQAGQQFNRSQPPAPVQTTVLPRPHLGLTPQAYPERGPTGPSF